MSFHRFVNTCWPVALDSPDYSHPWGTLRDNTMCPAYWAEVEKHFGRKVKYLDLGCAGGGLVIEANLLHGHDAVGLEGNDYWVRHRTEESQAAKQWDQFYGNCLFTCDISRPFFVSGLNIEVVDGSLHLGQYIEKFDLISAWEVLEHIHPDRLPFTLENIKNHLTPGGLFQATVSLVSDKSPGIELHQTLQTPDWWAQLLDKFFVLERYNWPIDSLPRKEENSLVFQGRLHQ